MSEPYIYFVVATDLRAAMPGPDDGKSGLAYPSDDPDYPNGYRTVKDHDQWEPDGMAIKQFDTAKQAQDWIDKDEDNWKSLFDNIIIVKVYDGP